MGSTIGETVELEETLFHLSIESPHKAQLKRSKSHQSFKTKNVAEPDTSSLLFPYTQLEKDRLTKEYLESYDYNILLEPELEKQIINNKFSKYQTFIETCEFRQNNYNNLIAKSLDIVKILGELTVKYDTVTKETYEFQEQSDKLINEYNGYMNLNEELKQDLSHFELLESFTRKLNNPSPNIVRKSSFKKLLTQLDECLVFIDQHKDFKDFEVYNLRFKQCLVRALTLIRNYVINNLKNIRDEITGKVAATKVNSVTQDALLYTRFGSDLEFLFDVSSDLVNRAEDSKELEGLLSDCFNFYFGIRTRLVNPKIWEHLNHSTTVDSKKSLVQFAQSNISFFTKVFRDEFELFHKIFPKDSNNALLHWFQNLSEPLNDTLRNSILKESSISSLCELVTLLDKYYEYDDEEEEFELTAQDEEDSIKPEFEKIDLGAIFHPILQDVQSRLVFRAQVYVEETIVKYKPSVRDFQIGNRRKSEATTEENKDDPDSSFALSSNKQDLQDSYKPLSKGISLLSKIYQLVSSSVFDDMAHNIVHDCIISLRNAYKLAKPTIGKLDSELFFLKNLLLLRAQIQNFDIEYVSNETFLDFSGVGEIINKIRNGTSVFNTNGGGLVELVRDSVPKVVNNMIDARLELQSELRNVVHEFTEDAVQQIINPITKLSPETAEKDSLALKDNIESSLPRLKGEIELFIDDRQIVTSLIDGIQELIIQNYEQYYNTIISKTSQEIIDVDTLIAVIGEIVGKIYEEQNEYDETQSRLDGLGLQSEVDDDELNVSS
ncbi:Conserved oligomeric Golgi complex subunit [Wickerhamomyces ciferrii]|uniref:Conserved oligomeric Golgi complex subunit 3 n=1 Tax=Wickerhamomyces ciferrii (strain ATCC 14091 / BCRC 22168 / CBS 111 / JCM 3599 / NBRC 0793 / NRRL Y-1031 F-60-10) TaxID=1206466 RepID=K0KJ86_WICCF|nr:Conserved oligomeric Golgi complex subunit [Wickerhamomyces ciferrii]CCH41554.1 Conserved oligomeric Golgi complex subunit [Wickerhamomyces ciferrii]